MAVGADRDSLGVRWSPLAVNFRQQPLTQGWTLLADDPSIGRLNQTLRDREQAFLMATQFPVSYVQIDWLGASAIRQDQLEARIVRRQANGLPVIAHYISDVYNGGPGQLVSMIVPFTQTAPDSLPAAKYVRGQIWSRNAVDADPGGWVIDSVTLHAGPVPADQNATVVP